jgi:uncharacterized protein YdhG (YjbR/CyaY superfamily)
MSTNIAKNVDDYIDNFPDEVKTILIEIRNIILEVTPDCKESISYAMPGYKLKSKPLVYFAGYKNHIGFYGTPSTHNEFSLELNSYVQGKGSVQFPLDKPIPYDLIKRMVVYRSEELLKK